MHLFLQIIAILGFTCIACAIPGIAFLRSPKAGKATLNEIIHYAGTGAFLVSTYFIFG